MYRLGQDAAGGEWPFLHARHAYLADGTPLTEFDENGRIVPGREVLNPLRKICSGGSLSLADRRSGIEALARALDKDDQIRAPILLLQLQIDPEPAFVKFNPNHKPPGPGGGRFTSGPWSGSNSYFQEDPLEGGAVEPIAQDMHVGFNSTYQKGVYGEDIDKAHDLVVAVVGLAILQVGSQDFRPGMPEYGRKLHDAVATAINALDDPRLVANPVYLGGNEIQSGQPKGSSVPDIYYESPTGKFVVWELKTGRAVDLQDPDNVDQKDRTLKNIPDVIYEYIQVYER
jgi:hypothetical protein